MSDANERETIAADILNDFNALLTKTMALMTNGDACKIWVDKALTEAAMWFRMSRDLEKIENFEPQVKGFKVTPKIKVDQ